MTEAAPASILITTRTFHPVAGFIADALLSWRAQLCWMSSSSEEAREPSAADRADIQATIEGDHDAYARLVRRYQQRIGNYLWRFTQNATDHEDLVHGVFVEAYISLPTFRAHGVFRNWLLTIATRVGFAYWKQRARRRDQEVLLEAAPEPMSVEKASNEEADLERLEMILASMSPRDRLVLTLLHLEERSVAETAKLTGWSQSMVKVQAHRARKKLKRLIEESEHESKRS
jgi:RNA polymerase sigma-70 factor (ECF subfamily)